MVASFAVGSIRPTWLLMSYDPLKQADLRVQRDEQVVPVLKVAYEV